MATTPNQAAVEAQILAGINTAANVAGVLDPQIIPFLILGKAVAAAFPDLINDVEALVSGSDPTAADNSALAAKIVALGNPAAL